MRRLPCRARRERDERLHGLRQSVEEMSGRELEFGGRSGLRLSGFSWNRPVVKAFDFVGLIDNNAGTRHDDSCPVFLRGGQFVPLNDRLLQSRAFRRYSSIPKGGALAGVNVDRVFAHSEFPSTSP
jgi:hypothetical protein